MALLSQIQKRYSVRAYQDRLVEEEKVRNVLEAARLAPSARNLQEWRFVVIRDEETRRRLVPAANGQVFVGQAPVVIACCARGTDYVMRGGQKAYAIDVAIAMSFMTLQAVEEGLGTCWIGSFYEDQVKAVLEIPADVRVVELLTLGYPQHQAGPRKRLTLGQIACDERWRF